MSGDTEAPSGPAERTARHQENGRRHYYAAEPAVVSVQRGYELWAGTYDQELNSLLALEERLLTAMLPNLSGSRVLDVACGTGRWLEKLLRRGAGLGIGVDCSPAMMAVARRKGLLRGRLIQADILALPLANAAADFVMCSFAIGHFPEIATLAAELARVASPQATVYVSDVHPDAYRRGWRTGFQSNGRAVQITTYCHPLANIRQAFDAQGLELTAQVEGKLGEPEKPVFERAGQLDRFDECKDRPAIVISRFNRPLQAQRDQA